jgi:hypothetical protein
MRNKVHIFWSWLWADWIESKDNIMVTIKELNEKSDFDFTIVTDIEETKRWVTIKSVENNKEEARKRASDLIEIFWNIDKNEKFKWLIIRINPLQSKSYQQDRDFFCQLSQEKKNMLAWVYVPDFEHADQIDQVIKELWIQPYQIMPIIETEHWHKNLVDIAKKLLYLSEWKDIYIIWTWDAYHRFLDRAKQHFLEEEFIYLTPDTSLWWDTASKLAHSETVWQIIKLNELNTHWNLHVMLATSTLIQDDLSPWDITGLAIDHYNKSTTYNQHTWEHRNMKWKIWKVTIHPSQLKTSDNYKKYWTISSKTAIAHNHTSEEIVGNYLKQKDENKIPIYKWYVLLDAQFYIALFKEFKKYWVKNTVKNYPLLQKYMGKESSLLLEDIFEDFKEDIVQYQN